MYALNPKPKHDFMQLSSSFKNRDAHKKHLNIHKKLSKSVPEMVFYLILFVYIFFVMNICNLYNVVRHS